MAPGTLAAVAVADAGVGVEEAVADAGVGVEEAVVAVLAPAVELPAGTMVGDAEAEAALPLPLPLPLPLAVGVGEGIVEAAAVPAGDEAVNDAEEAAGVTLGEGETRGVSEGNEPPLSVSVGVGVGDSEGKRVPAVDPVFESVGVCETAALAVAAAVVFSVVLSAAAGDDKEAASATSRGRARSIVASDELHRQLGCCGGGRRKRIHVIR